MESWTVSWLSLEIRDYVGAESWVAIGGGYTEFAGFSVVHQKTTGFLGWSTQPRPKNWRRRCSSIRPVLPVDTGLTGEEHRSDQCAMTQSGDFEAGDTRRDRKACVEAKQVCGHWASVRWCYEDNFPKFPWWACILV
jgi:hypothetical protein